MNQIKDYILVSEHSKEQFNEKSKKLIQDGYVPCGKLKVIFRKGHFDVDSFFLYSQCFKLPLVNSPLLEK